MDVTSLCPLSIGVLFWQAAPAAWKLTIVCKATYRVQQGTAALHDLQDGIQQDDQGEDVGRSRGLRAACDLVPWKPAADVLVVGHAFAPPGKPAGSLLARVAIGAVNKAVELVGARGWSEHGGPVQGPALGLGPVALAWPEPAVRLGVAASHFGPGAWRTQALPAGFDLAGFQSAPRDQRTPHLRGDETLVLEHLHPEHAVLRTRLPGLRPRALLERNDGVVRPLVAVADTLWIDTDRSLMTLVWRMQTDLSHPIEPGCVTLTLEAGDGQPIAAGSRLQSLRAEDLAAQWARLLPPDGEPASPPVVPPPRPAPPPRPSSVVPLPSRPASVVPPRAALPAAAIAARPPAGETLELLWFHPAAPAKLRTNAQWKRLLGSSKLEPRDLDDDSSAEQRKKARHGREVLAILKRAGPVDARRIERALDDAVLDGVFTPPLVVVAGELEPLLDEVEALQATLLTVGPFTAADKRLKDTVEWAKEVLQTPGFDAAGSSAEGVTSRVREAFGETRRGLPAGFLSAQVERMLLRRRRYQKRLLLGVEWLRCALRVQGGGEAIATYLPGSAAGLLPMFRAFRVRAVVEVRPPLEAAGAVALTCLGLASISR
jgi:hypothetical protein